MLVDNINSQSITPANGNNPRQLYEHQEEALRALDGINHKSSFKTMLVLPTGGGKTLTAAYWLLRNAVDKGKKVLWIAHRHLLLEQAADAFRQNAYTDNMVNHTEFNYRIISGMHDKPIHIKADDNVLIVGKDSIIRSLELLKDWLDDEDIYLVIDEAHHAVAKSYKRIIAYVEENARTVRMLGLTATPFRTSKDEQGALLKVFIDNIVYKTDLLALIKRGILSRPIFEEHDTQISLGNGLGVSALKNIENFDKLPEDIIKDIESNKERNSLIVNRYIKNRDKYGQTIVFALNKNHAIALNKLFNAKGEKYGIKSEYIISSVTDEATGITISNEENDAKIKKYRNGEIQILINVNILTEGTDLPQTHTVFLTRPTVSTVLMTQMVGRALRGVKAGGTKDAYIVSFVDNWNDKIAWVNPKTLANEEYNEKEFAAEKRAYNIQLISISKIEEFALMADASVDTSGLDRIASIERIPLGMYSFSTDDWSHQILIYNSNQIAYKNLIADLPNIMEHFEVDSDVIADNKLEEMTAYCFSNYLDEKLIPKCDIEDIEYLLRFYAQKEVEPAYITIDEIDRKKLDIADIAKKFHDEDLRGSEKKAYLESLWNEEGSIIRIYYRNILFLKRLIDTECDKLDGYIEAADTMPRTEAEKRNLEELPLQKIIDKYPQYGLELKEKIYSLARNCNGEYVCAMCKKAHKTRRYLQIDHIVPMSKGGKTVPDNLQVLCRSCNMKKGDK